MSRKDEIIVKRKVEYVLQYESSFNENKWWSDYIGWSTLTEAQIGIGSEQKRSSKTKLRIIKRITTDNVIE